MLRAAEIARYHENGQLTPSFRLSGETIARIERKMEALYERRAAIEEERLQFEAEFADMEKDAHKDTHPPKKMRARPTKHHHSAA